MADGLVPGGEAPAGTAEAPGDALVDGATLGDTDGLTDGLTEGLGSGDGVGVGCTGPGTKAMAAAMRSVAVMIPANSARTTARRCGMAGRVPVPSGDGGLPGDRLG